MNVPDYSKQSKRKRPGEPYKKGDVVTNRIIDSIVNKSKFLDKLHYEVNFKDCGHKGAASHKTLTRAEISGKDGICRECLRRSRAKKVKPKKNKVSPWPPHPDREKHYLAHRIMSNVIKGVAL